MSQPRKITRLFIANRGEIARRIALTARRLGIKTVAISKGPPKHYLAQVIDHFVRVEEEDTALYLDQKRMIDLAVKNSCDGVHPGFGFLSEFSDFARRVLGAKLIWVGPAPAAMDSMGSKTKAKEIAVRCGVPIIEGLGEITLSDTAADVQRIAKFADSIGYPVLIKAAYGGGGKGMRIIHSKDQIKDLVVRCHSEARSSFGHGSLLVERYLEAPRHVELQVLGDRHGNLTILGDRDCSLQRRNQKIIEEAPAPDLSDKLRSGMSAAASKLAKSVNYDSAGTVEFLVEKDTKKGDRFYFLEMNTRLQVEHPVTEQVFGLDLVEWQIRIAENEVLPSTMKNLQPRGHSIEARIYAEDSEKDFFPSPGPVYNFRPFIAAGIRWEIGVDEQDEITSSFDPMIAKVVSHAESRHAALALLNLALAETHFAGPPNNLQFLGELCSRSPFLHGPVAVSYLGSQKTDLLQAMLGRAAEIRPSAQALFHKLSTSFGSSWQTLSHHPIDTLTRAAFGSGDIEPEASSNSGEVFGVTTTTFGDTQVTGGRIIAGDSAPIFTLVKSPSDCKIWLNYSGIHLNWADEGKATLASAKTALNSSEIIAPVPGKVVAIHIDKGDNVRPFQTLFVLESMKMEFEIKAHQQATIKEISVKVGDQVGAGRSLAILKS